MGHLFWNILHVLLLAPSIDYRIVPGSFPTLLLRDYCRRLDHGIVGCCVGVLLFTSFAT